jgi:protein transport protein SEC24
MMINANLCLLGVVTTVTGGDTYFYPHYNAAKDGRRFQEDLKLLLAREFGFNAMLRVRCSDGLRVAAHFGNFFMRNATDLELAGIDSEKTISVQLKHDDKLDEKQEAVFQCALLYTRADGQRRIRVHNISIPCTSTMSDLFRHADMNTTVNHLLKMASVEVLSKPLKTVRDHLAEKCVQILSSYRRHCATSTSPGQVTYNE